MRRSFPVRMAFRETRGARARLALYTVSITAGVASLVAIGSFRTNVTDSVRDQARTVLGADLELAHRNDFPEPVVELIDSLEASGKPATRSVSFGSMVLAPSGRTRLMQVRGIGEKSQLREQAVLPEVRDAALLAGAGLNQLQI